MHYLIALLTFVTPLLAVAAPGRSLDDPRVQEELGALKLEPTIQQAQSAALEFFNIDADTVSSMRSRAAVKALLPTVSAKIRQRSEGIGVETIDRPRFGDEIAREDDIRGSAFEWEVGGSWRLSQLVFNPEVLDVSSLAVLQEGVLKEVTRLYYTRRRLQVDLILQPVSDPATKLSKQLRIDELTATLDAMCGNVFTRFEKRAKKRRGRKGAKRGGGARR